MATEATKNLEPTKKNLLANQLSHSSTVENNHYNLDLHTTKAAVEAYELVQAAAAEAQVSSQEPSKSSTPSKPTPSKPKPVLVPVPVQKPVQKRVFFTRQETKLIEDYF